MDDILDNHQDLGEPHEYDKVMRTIVKDLNHLSPLTILRGRNTPADLLSNLDPQSYSAPYLYILIAHINAVGNPGDASVLEKLKPRSALWRMMERFMMSFDPVQIRYVGHELRRLIEKVIEIAYALCKPEIAIQPVKAAILRIDSSGATLTSTHLKFTRLCLRAEVSNEALAVVGKKIWHFPTDATPRLLQLPCSIHDTSSTYLTVASGLTEKLTYQQYLQYFFNVAMIYMMRHDWNSAFSFLQQVIDWPTNGSTSLIQVKAYEKWVLVGLLHRGKPSPMPENVKPQTAKDLRATCKAYDTLAEIYKEGDRARLEAEARAGVKVWQGGCNQGLVDQVIDSLRYHAIKNLGKTYLAMSLDQVARETAKTSPHPNDVAETRRYVQRMINNHGFNALISSAGYLCIARSEWDPPQSRSEAEHLQDLAKAEEKVKAANLQIEAANRRLSLSTGYISELRKIRKTKEKELEGASEEAEDMLADL